MISLFGFEPGRAPAGRFLTVDGIPHLISAVAGGHLRDLSTDFELAWCTGWDEKANEYLPRMLGLPTELPLVPFDACERPSGAHWKVAAIDAWLGSERAVAWIDDAHEHRCHAWALARPSPTLLVGTDPPVGITAGHVARLKAWVRGLRAPEQAA